MAGLVPDVFAKQVETVAAWHKAGHDGRQAACSLVSALGARISTEPPAFSTAATADLEAPNTESVTLALISPSPRSRTPSFARRRMPALTSAATSILAAASSLPASIAACSLPRFTSLSLRANLTFLKPRLGSRRCSGIWPPSKPLMRTPERAVWPLPPRPPVLPLPEPMPRPIRFRVLRAPGWPESSCSFIGYFSTTSTRWATFAIMPRVAGVSTSSATRPILLSLSPIRVSRWVCTRRDALPICRTLTVLPAFFLAFMTAPSSLGRYFGVAWAAARLQRRHFDVAACGDRARRILALERIECRAHDVIGVRRTDRLRHDVLHAERLEHRAHRPTGDDAGAGRRRAQINLAGAVTAGNVVMQRAAFAQRHPGQTALGGFGRFADRFRNLARLAVTEADPAFL